MGSRDSDGARGKDAPRPVRAGKLSPLERKQKARRAASARWGKADPVAEKGAKHPYAALEPREATLVAAAKMFSSRGYEEPTLKEIAAAAGVGLQTIYRFYPAKRELYLSVCSALQERMMAYYGLLIDANADAREKIYALALGVSHTHCHSHLIRLQHWKLLDPSSHILKEAAGDYWDRYYADYTKLFAEICPDNAEDRVIYLIGSIVGMSQYVNVMGDLSLVKKLLTDAEGIARYCLDNALPDFEWKAIRPNIHFRDFDLEWIGRPPSGMAI